MLLPGLDALRKWKGIPLGNVKILWKEVKVAYFNPSLEESISAHKWEKWEYSYIVKTTPSLTFNHNICTGCSRPKFLGPMVQMRSSFDYFNTVFKPSELLQGGKSLQPIKDNFK